MKYANFITSTTCISVPKIRAYITYDCLVDGLEAKGYSVQDILDDTSFPMSDNIRSLYKEQSALVISTRHSNGGTRKPQCCRLHRANAYYRYCR